MLLSSLSVRWLRPALGSSAIVASALLLGGCQDVVDEPIAKAKVTVSDQATAVADENALRDRLDRVIAFTRDRHLNPSVNNAWQIMHGVLAYGYDMQMNIDGKVMPGLQWILDDGKFGGWNLVPAEKGVRSVMDPGTKIGQGHEDQWLGYLSQAKVSPETPIVIKGQKFKVSDLIEQSKWDVRDGMEATWTLMALATLIPLDSKWTAKDGNEWTIERIVGMEAAQDLTHSACGGSHRLYGLSIALDRFRREGGKVAGGWLAAEQKINDSIAKAKAFQQPDGGFSANFFTRAATDADIGNRINSTGHTLEFLAVALSDKELAEPWMVRAVEFLCSRLEMTKDREVECGGLYHAAHGLQIYRQRRFGEVAQTKAVPVDSAKTPPLDAEAKN
jgi:hypothetical protein